MRRVSSALSNTYNMATKELRELRHKYKAAHTSYMQSVQALSDASHAGIWPDAKVLRIEEQALTERNFVRQALLYALHAHGAKKTNS